MANDSYTQSALADSTDFRQRLAQNLAIVAWQIINEDPGTSNHEQRYNYARVTVLPNLIGVANSIAPWFVETTNILGANTGYDFRLRAVVTDATDGAIQSQLVTIWNVLAGV